MLSHHKYLGLIRKVLQELLDYHEVPEETSRRLILCVDEEAPPLLGDAHVWRPLLGTHRGTFDIDGDDFKVQIRDYGK